MTKGKILALDYGVGTVGLAVCDESQQIVFGKGAIQTKKGTADLIRQLQIFCEKERVKQIVVGLPLGMEGEETKQTERIHRFSEKLQESIKLPLSFQDESFTSFEAGRILNEFTGTQPRRKADEDEMAAILILKRYLKLDVL